MSHTNGAVATAGGMTLDDHHVTSARMSLLEELSMVMSDEIDEIYGNDSDLVTVAREALAVVQELRRMLRAQAHNEHPRSPRRLRQMYIQPQRPPRSVKPGMRRGGGTAHRAGLPA